MNNHDISFAMIPPEKNIRDFDSYPDKYQNNSMNKTYDYSNRNYYNNQVLQLNNKENVYASRSPNTRQAFEPK